MQHNFCDQEDCLLHPTYIKKEEERAKREAQAKGHLVAIEDGSQWAPASYDHSIFWDSSCISVQAVRIKTSTVDIPVECTICSHFKKLDMKEILIIEEAKKALND